MFNITKYATRNSAVVKLLMAICVVGGIYAFISLGKREDSTFTIKSAVVTCSYEGATPEEVERLVVEPLEREIRTLRYLDEIDSEAHFGYARLVVKLRPDTPSSLTPQLWDELRRKLSDVRPALPHNVGVIEVADDFGDVYGLYYALAADEGYTWMQMREYAESIEREIYHVEGVDKVLISGEQPYEVRITIKPATLAMFDLRPEEIGRSIEQQSANIALGEVTSNTLSIIILEGSPYTAIGDIENQLLTAVDGKQYRLGDIMQVELRQVTPPSFIMRVDGQRAIGIAVATSPDEDVVAVGREVEQTLRDIERTLPSGLELRTLYPENRIAEQATNNFLVNLAESLAIVILLVIIAMGWRSGIVVGSSLLLCVGATMLLMLPFDQTLNRTSLAGFIIAMGMLVDNAIVVTDNTSMLLLRGIPRHIAVVKGATAPRTGLLIATLIAIISFLPLQLAPSSVAEIIKPLFIVVALSLLISWLLSLTQVPLMNLALLRPATQRDNDYERAAWFRPIVAMLIRFRWVVIVVVVALFALSVMSMGQMPQNFFPRLAKPMFRADVILPAGYDIATTDDHLLRITEWLHSQPEVRQVSTTAGGTPPRYYLASGSYAQQPNYGNLLIEVGSHTECEDLERRLNEWVTTAMPDVWLRSSLFKLSPVPDATIEFGFVGDNIDTLSSLTERCMALMRSCGEATNIRCSWTNRQPVYQPRYSQLKGQRIGVDRQSMMQSVEMATRGMTIGSIRRGDQELSIRLHTDLIASGDVEALATMPVFSARGDAYSIEQASAGFEFGFERPVIKRIDGFRVMMAQCDPRPEVNTIELVGKLQRLVTENITLPEGYRIELYGEEQSREESNAALASQLPLTLMLIVLLLVLLLGNYREPLIILLTLPLILIGVVLALLIAERPFDFFSLLGLLGLVGMQIKSAVILVERIRELRAEGYSVDEAAARAAADRLTPVVTAAATTVLGLIPLLFDPMFGSMATTIMGGLIVATILVVALLPVVYSIFYRYKSNV